MKTRRLKVNSRRNSECGSARLGELYWSQWFDDFSFGDHDHYLHVAGPDNSWHRVRCRHQAKPRLECIDGMLYWLVDDD